jgi:hydroxymethylglutaryl-CoA reductase
MNQPIKGFSKLSKEGKLEWLTSTNFARPEEAHEIFSTYWHADAEVQKRHDEFIENTMTNYYMPYGVAPNFNINGRFYT